MIDYSKPVRLDIACGDDMSRRNQGFIGVDILDLGQEVVWDIEQGLPFADNSVDEIFSSHTLEHLDNPLSVLNEFHRILKPEGFAHIIVPSVDHLGAFLLSHNRFFNETTFKYLERKDVNRDYGMKRWKVVSIVTNERKDIHCRLKPIK